MARPKKKIDEVQLEKLAFMNTPTATIADLLGISQDTLKRRFADKIAFFASKGKAKLRQKLWEKALNQDYFPAQKLLASHELGINEKVTIAPDDNIKPFTLAYSLKDLKDD